MLTTSTLETPLAQNNASDMRFLEPSTFKVDDDGRPHGMVVWRRRRTFMNVVEGSTPYFYTPYVNGRLHGKVTVSDRCLKAGKELHASLMWKRPATAHVQDCERLTALVARAKQQQGNCFFMFMDSLCANEAAFTERAAGLRAKASVMLCDILGQVMVCPSLSGLVCSYWM
jgi:hypothetical protein